MKVKEKCNVVDGIGVGELELDHPYPIGGEDTVLDSVKAEASKYINDAVVAIYDWLYNSGNSENKKAAFALAEVLDDKFIARGSMNLQALPKGSKVVKGTLKVIHELGVDIPKDAETNVGGALSDLTKRYGFASGFLVVTKNFNWKAGEFGDAGSCYFTDNRRTTREWMEAADNFIAVQLKDEDLKGVGRCWGYVLNGGIVLFNVYSKVSGDFSLSTMGGALRRVLPEALDLAMEKITLTDNGSTEGRFYVNNRGSALLLGHRPLVLGRSKYDITTSLDTHKQCYECKQLFIANGVRSFNSRSYCTECFNKLFERCDICGSWVPKSTLKSFRNRHMCSGCISALHHCSECGEPFFDSELTVKQGNYVCLGCSSKFHKCTNCGRGVKGDIELTFPEEYSYWNGFYCSDCSSKVIKLAKELGVKWTKSTG